MLIEDGRAARRKARTACRAAIPDAWLLTECEASVDSGLRGTRKGGEEKRMIKDQGSTNINIICMCCGWWGVQMQSRETDKKRLQLTMTELEETPQDVKLYKSLGKM